MNFVDVERVCRRLMEEFLPFDLMEFPTRHAEYINAIDASDPFCADVQLAYSRCVWCMAVEPRNDCRRRHQVVQCGGQPTLDQVINDTTTTTTTANYSRYTSEQDIDLYCNFMQEFGDHPFLSVDMCIRQKEIKHLCPGYCEGGCFSENPTCGEEIPTIRQPPPGGLPPGGGSPPEGARPSPPQLTPCELITARAFFGVDIDVIMNVSNHGEYLKSIQASDPSCPEAQAAYSDCIWCNPDNLCFSEEHPPSCNTTTNNGIIAAWEEDMMALKKVQDVCLDISKSLFQRDGVGIGVGVVTAVSDGTFDPSQINIPKGSQQCENAQQLFHKCLWCAPHDGTIPDNFCIKHAACNNRDFVDQFLTPELETFTLDRLQRHAENNTLEEDNNNNPVLEDIEKDCDALIGYLGKDIYLSLQGCYEELILVKYCPDQYCPPIETALAQGETYLGATTDSEKMALIWLSRTAAILSFLGASYVLYSCLSDVKARVTVYHQLLVGMAVFDLVTAVSWSLATIPIDTTFSGTDHILGAMGNEASCKAQGFFIQLGFTSVFYNVSLSLYYLLVIAHGWREFQLKKIHLFLHGVPCMLGLGLALGALGSYNFMGYACHLLPHPEGSLGTVLLFVIIPLGLSIVVITSCMLVVYSKVRARAGASRKWSLGVGAASKMEQAVFWQCLFYVMAFYITWPIMFAVYLGSVGVNGPLGLALTIAFVAPLSGFTNFLVYIRPKLIGRDNGRLSTTSRRRSSQSVRASSSVLVSAVLRMLRRHEISTADEDVEGQAQIPDHKMDPSVAIAMEMPNPTPAPSDMGGDCSVECALAQGSSLPVPKPHDLSSESGAPEDSEEGVSIIDNPQIIFPAGDPEDTGDNAPEVQEGDSIVDNPQIIVPAEESCARLEQTLRNTNGERINTCSKDQPNVVEDGFDRREAVAEPSAESSALVLGTVEEGLVAGDEEADHEIRSSPRDQDFMTSGFEVDC
ncbi:expressed unknown protein [Seminavis robusta]|uniref:G-protein coupled receptors family 1 profile domain-containing protein n=1 Tax=Seminavis robusta TaxID=568900 RepID=A0A9N8EMB9_9STRA|nr:expressed unknown protein [Seminavis robusta]|eukprot:Sro1404_g269700.1 n/a (971) ;mRNA; f:4021-7102